MRGFVAHQIKTMTGRITIGSCPVGVPVLTSFNDKQCCGSVSQTVNLFPPQVSFLVMVFHHSNSNSKTGIAGKWKRKRLTCAWPWQ